MTTPRFPRTQRPRRGGMATTSTFRNPIGPPGPPALDDSELPAPPRLGRPGLPRTPAPGTPPATPPLYPEPAPPTGGGGVPGAGDGPPAGPPTMGIGPVPTPATPVTPVAPGGPTMGIMPVPGTTPITGSPGGPTMGIMPINTPTKPLDQAGPSVPTPTSPVAPRPLYPNGPDMGIPGGPGSGQNPPGQPGQPGQPGAPLPPGFGLDFMREITPNELVANQLQALLNSDSAYMQNADQRGREFANSRGALNSSIGAGAARRAALEAAMPIAQADAQAYREANAANFASLSQLRQMRVAGDIENWLNDQTYTREWNGNLAMLPIGSSIDMLQYIMQRGMEDPSVFTPDVLSGLNNFFNGNMFDILSRYYGPQTTPGGG